MEVLVCKVDIDHGVLKFRANANDTNRVPRKDPVLPRLEIVDTIGHEGHLGIETACLVRVIVVLHLRDIIKSDLSSVLLGNWLLHFFIFLLSRCRIGLDWGTFVSICNS